MAVATAKGASKPDRTHNIEAMRQDYYSRIDPRRVFYLYDRGGENERLRRLGTATEMAIKAAVAPHE